MTPYQGGLFGLALLAAVVSFFLESILRFSKQLETTDGLSLHFI
jgi:hypothetical protein